VRLVRLEDGRVAEVEREWRGVCGIVVTALTAGVPPDGMPAKLWSPSPIGIQLVLDVWFGEEGRRGLSWLPPDAAPPDALTINRALTRIRMPLHYQLELVPFGQDRKTLVARVDQWHAAVRAARARTARAVSHGRRKMPPWAVELFDALEALDPSAMTLAALAPPDQQTLNAQRRVLGREARQHGQWAMVAYAATMNAAAWVEVQHALQRGIPVDVCGFCSRYYFRAGSKAALCQNCQRILHRSWRHRRQFQQYSKLARAMAAPMFWTQPHKVAREGTHILNVSEAAVRVLRAQQRDRKEGKEHASSARGR
jgi:hypothetical protein